MSHRTYFPLLRGAKTLIVLAALCFSPSGRAIDANGKWTDRGIGSNSGSCGDYLRSEIENRRWYESWLLGYVSGINRAQRGRTDFSNGAATQGLAQWIENYCKQNPLSSFGDAVDAMLNELDKKR